MRVVIPTVATAALLAVIYAAQADDSAPKADEAQQNEALRERPDNLSGENLGTREPLIWVVRMMTTLRVPSNS